MTTVDDIMISDLEDEDFGNSYVFDSPSYLLSSFKGLEPFTLNLSCELRNIIFGYQNIVFPPEWLNQSLSFNHPNVTWGIVQHKGGPCGVIAAVQAKVLKELLMAGLTRDTHVTSKMAVDALVRAISSILWDAGSGERAIVVLNSGIDQFIGAGVYRSDGVTEKLVSASFNNYKKLQEFLLSNIYQFQNENSNGVLLILYSVILSRGIKLIQEDVDIPGSTLITVHKHCTQDLVNLMLVGQAVSNVHDGSIMLSGKEQMTLKGIPFQADVGLLSLYEHYKIVEVGSYLKVPNYPVWVICSENHYSVLYAHDVELLGHETPDEFNLYYFDGLAKLDKEITLTLRKGYSYSSETRPEHLIPALELCIRSKWKNYTIDWNDQEPLL